MRRVLLGEDPAGVRLNKRATGALESVRETERSTVSSGGMVFVESDDGYRWYTYAGGPKNTLPEDKRPIPQVNSNALWGPKFADTLWED